jgi:uncharacterized protein (DUF488 family)
MSGSAERPAAGFFTIGHSTRPLDEFVGILKTYGIVTLVDVRTIPRSRYNPQFNRDKLPQELERRGIRYTHEPGLGGLRHARKDSPNGAWQNSSFRGFADYMQTPEFVGGLNRLIDTARAGPAAIMCAEAVPWRCHRSLIADALLVRGFSVGEIMSATNCKPHVLTPWAKVDGLKVWYPPETGKAVHTAKIPVRKNSKGTTKSKNRAA